MSGKHKEQRVGVFVDVANMYHSAKNLYQGARVDFNKILKQAVSGRYLIHAFAYVIKADIEPEKGFFEALQRFEYVVRAKDLQVFSTGTKKGNWDVGLCMDAIRHMDKFDVVVLVSGDGDYVDLLDYLRSRGVRTEVIGFGKTTSSKLIEEADEFLDLDQNPQKFLQRKQPTKDLSEQSVKS